MVSNLLSSDLPGLEQILDRHLPFVKPEMPLHEAMTRIDRGWGRRLQSDVSGKTSPSRKASSSFLLVQDRIPADIGLAAEQGLASAIGIVTQENLIQAMAAAVDRSQLTVAEVMAQPLIVLKAEEFQDIFTVLALFRQHRIHYLPIADREGKLLGTVAAESLCQALQNIHLFKLRRVADVMTMPPVCLPATASLQQIVQQMASHRINSIAIAPGENAELPGSCLSFASIGMVAARELVRSQLLGLDLQQTQAQAIMQPWTCLKPSDSLWKACQTIVQKAVPAVAIAGSQGELLGIVTLDNILQLLDPKVMYSAIAASDPLTLSDPNPVSSTIVQRRSAIVPVSLAEIWSGASNDQGLLPRVPDRDPLVEHQRIEAALRKARDELERRFEERTAELSRSNLRLKQEIGERRRAEETLRLTQFFLDRAAISTFLIGSDGRLLYVNDAACLQLGYSRPELLSMRIYDIDLDSPAAVWPEHWRTLKEFGSLALESRHRTKDGRTIPVELTINYLAFRGREYNCAFALNIQERKRAEAEIRSVLAKEQELSELKSRFVSMASHEFRTPLSIIFSSAELLERYSHKWSSEKKLTHFQRIQTAVKHMNEILNDVLFIGKAETGRLEIQRSPLDLVRFCRDLAEDLQLCDRNQHPISFESQQNHIHTCVDEKLLRHILTNLLSNAMKYSPAGSPVNFSLNCHQGEARFQISDRGIGIPSADQHHLFESFHRASNVGTISGTGLGLAIVKRCIDIYGGQIHLNSTVEIGTTFTVVLPVEIQEHNHAENSSD